jgi:FkbM family methyltransferase
MGYSRFYQKLLQQNTGAWFDFEGLIRDVYVSLLTSGDWAIDAGAHRGDHTFQMAQAVAPHGRVIAIEAVPTLVADLKATTKKLHPHLKRIIEYHCRGLSDSDGEEIFYFAPQVAGLSGLRRRTVIASQHVDEIKIPVTTLDRICANVTGSIRFIKMDIEGAEYHALRGGTGTIARHRPVVVFEHDANSPSEFGYSISQMLALWSSLNYKIYDFFGNSYEDVEAWKGTMVWNFLAIPPSYSAAERIFKTVHETLTGLGIVYEPAY